MKRKSPAFAVYWTHKEDIYMKNALDIISKKLKSTGMDDTEINHLLAKFLEEEAFQYVEYVSSHLLELSKKIDDNALMS